MTNNLDDFEQPGLEHNEGLPPPAGMRANLSHAWRTRPLFKLLVLMIIAGAILAIGISLFSSPKQAEVTRIASPPSGMHQPPGGAASQFFLDQTKMADEERSNNATKTGGSFIPTPTGANTSVEDLVNPAPKTDPLRELRTQLDAQNKKIFEMEHKNQPPVPQQPAKPPEPFDDSLAQAMQKQMKQLSDDWTPKGITQVSGAKEDNKKLGVTSTGTSDMNAMNTPAMTDTSRYDVSGGKKFAAPVISAGTVSYAQLLTEANSDAPGPILAQILSGPLAGARAVGEFKVSHELLVLKFSLANLKGIDYRIDAIALDPDTTLGAMATEVDERWVTRVLLPAAAGFIQGFGQALGQNSSSIATNGSTTIIQQSGKGLEQGIYTGIGQAGQSMSQFFQNQANDTKPLVKVAAGTPIGMFFTGTVCSGAGCPLPDVQDLQSKASNSGGYPGGGYQNGYPSGYGSNQGANGYNGSPQTGYYPGMTMPGYNGQPSGTGITYNNGPNSNSGSNSSSPSSVPYNTTNPPPLSQPNGIYPGTGLPGFGTTVINP